MPTLIDLSGQRFGRLVVIQRAGKTAYGQPIWLCRCDCGAESSAYGNSLRTGATQSCGCLRLERITTHGKTRTPEFTVWQMMRQRCNNPNHASYPDYGGRGIRVCDRWNASFADFLSDLGPRPGPGYTLERQDNSRDYEPGNCHWATPLEQGQNKRNNRVLEHQGERLTVSEWCRRLGLKKSTVLNRLARGAPASEALSPLRRRSAGSPRSPR